jgi:outer membrane lipoprotein
MPSPALRLPATLILLAALAGCAAPVLKDAPAISPTTAEVAAAPERYHDAEVVWGGKIVAIENLADTTEVAVVAYPLARGQRPDTRAPSQGRFVLVLPGFVEPMDFPPGRWLSLRGRVAGSEVRTIDRSEVVHPRVRDADVHLWPREFPDDRGHWSFGVGVGVGIR